MTTDVDIASADLWMEQALGHKVPGQLNRADAHALTAKIKAYAGVALVLLVAAHEHKVHKAMGYKTWAEYVETEFGYSAGRSYQLLTQSRIVMEISSLVSTQVDIPERDARELAKDLPAAKALAIEVSESLPDDTPPEVKGAAVAKALKAKRPKVEAGEVDCREAVSPGSLTQSGSDQSDAPDAAGPGDDGQEREPAPNPAPKVAPPLVIPEPERESTLLNALGVALQMLDGLVASDAWQPGSADALRIEFCREVFADVTRATERMPMIDCEVAS